MGSADKARKRDEDKVEAWVEPAASEAVSGTILPHDRDEDDAIGELLGESTAPVAPRRFRVTWTHVRWALLAAFILSVAIPLTFWTGSWAVTNR